MSKWLCKSCVVFSQCWREWQIVGEQGHVKFPVDTCMDSWCTGFFWWISGTVSVQKSSQGAHRSQRYWASNDLMLKTRNLLGHRRPFQKPRHLQWKLQVKHKPFDDVEQLKWWTRVFCVANSCSRLRAPTKPKILEALDDKPQISPKAPGEMWDGKYRVVDDLHGCSLFLSVVGG